MTRMAKGILSNLAPKAGIVKQNSRDLLTTVTQPGRTVPANCKMPKRVIHVRPNKVDEKAVDNGQKLYMGNSATADIKRRDVILKMTPRKRYKLT
ncbi:hypothetical protein Tco_0223064 [Tanacetum coccineum]